MAVGVALHMDIDPGLARQLMNARVEDKVQMNYTFTIDNSVYGAQVELSAKVTDPHKLLGEEPTLFEVLSLLLTQCAEAKLR